MSGGGSSVRSRGGRGDWGWRGRLSRWWRMEGGVRGVGDKGGGGRVGGGRGEGGEGSIWGLLGEG